MTTSKHKERCPSLSQMQVVKLSHRIVVFRSAKERPFAEQKATDCVTLLWTSFFLFLTTFGCGGPKLPAASETEKKTCREALIAALDAWQAGKLGELKSRTPPVTFTDDDVVLGNGLVSYEFDPTLEVKPHTDVAVNLIIRDREGKTQHRTATYQVTLSPDPSVIRNDP